MQYDENTEKYGYEGEMTPMKCDELQSVYIDRTGDWVRSGNDTGKFYLKSEVDEAVTELKAAWQSKHNICEMLKKELEDATVREHRLKRALYKACTNWAHLAVAFFSSYATKEQWRKMETECRAKEEEYK